MTRLGQLHPNFQLSYQRHLSDPKCMPQLWTKPLFHWVLSSQDLSVPEEPRLDVDCEEATEQQSSCFTVITTHGYGTRNPLYLDAYDLACSQHNVIYPSRDIFRKNIQNQILLNLIFHCKVWGSLLISYMVPSVQRTLCQQLLDFPAHPFFLQPFLFTYIFIL